MKNILFNKLLKQFIANGNKTKALEIIEKLHIADIAEIFEKLTAKEREYIYNEMEAENLGELITELNHELQEEMISIIDNNTIKKMLELMSNDDIVDIFGELSELEVMQLMKLLDKEEQEEVRRLRNHESDTAGGLMTTDYFSVFSGLKVKEVIIAIKKRGEEAELIYYIYVIDKKTGVLMGIASLRELIVSSPDVTIDKIMKKNIISVNANVDQEEVAAYFSKYDLLGIPVIDERNRLQGIITVDDIIDVLEEEATEDIYAMAGLTEEETDGFSVFSSVKIRLPWLMVSLFGELISALIMQKFGGTLDKLVALAFFVPLIMAMGGNSGSQSSAVMVRKIALGELEKGKLKKIILKESLSGVFLGIISGVMVGIIAFLWQGSSREAIMLGIIIGIALFVAISFAGSFGVFIPLLFNKLNIDPAVASGPFITTLNDVGGILIYFSLASLMLVKMGG